VNDAERYRKVVEPAEFGRQLSKYLELAKIQLRKDVWVGEKPSKVFYNFDCFNPYMQKMLVPENSDVFIWGDLHGSAHALLRKLDCLRKENYIDDNFKIMKSDCYFLFLGDYVDRGLYGVEVLYTLFRLKIANPDHVVLLRGNHEDMHGNIGPNCCYNFGFELYKKYGKRANALSRMLSAFCESLPSALFLGVDRDFILCVHGGLEFGINPKNLVRASGDVRCQLIKKVCRQSNSLQDPVLERHLKMVPRDELKDFVPHYSSHNGYGFLWSDFCLDETVFLRFNPNRGFQYGRNFTTSLLQSMSSSQARVHRIFRAHQHNGVMLELLRKHRGVVSIWDGLVYTFLSAGEPFGLSFDMVALLKTATHFEDWQLKRYPN